MSIVLLAHDYAQGGTTNYTPNYVEVTIDTRGADYLYVGCSGEGTHPALDTFTDSMHNTWNEVPGSAGPGSDHPGTNCQSRYFWVTNPLTSATHSFRMTTVNTAQLSASMIASAWTGVEQAGPFTSQTWAADQLSPSLGSVEGLMIAGCIIGAGDGNTGTNTATPSTGWTSIDEAPNVNGVSDSFVGLSLAYKVLASTGTASITWTVPPGGQARKGAGIMAFLEGAGPPPPPAPTVFAIRREHRFMLPWDDANRVKFVQRFELILQSGIGTSAAPNPTIMLRLSKDGGNTWGHELQMQAGPSGAVGLRAFINRVNVRGRNMVAQLAVSDPVDWQFVQALIDYEEGTS